MGLRDRIKQERARGRLRAQLVKDNGERMLAVKLTHDPDGGLLIHRAIERGEAV